MMMIMMMVVVVLLLVVVVVLLLLLLLLLLLMIMKMMMVVVVVVMMTMMLLLLLLLMMMMMMTTTMTMTMTMMTTMMIIIIIIMIVIMIMMMTMMMICFIYFSRFTCTVIYFAISLNSQSLAGDVFLNTLILGAIEIPSNLICILLIDIPWIGRKLTTASGLIIAGVTSLAAIPLFVTSGGECKDVNAFKRMIVKYVN